MLLRCQQQRPPRRSRSRGRECRRQGVTVGALGRIGRPASPGVWAACPLSGQLWPPPLCVSAAVSPRGALSLGSLVALYGSVAHLRSTWLWPGSYRANIALGLGVGCSQRRVSATPVTGRTSPGLVWAWLPAWALSSLAGPGNPGLTPTADPHRGPLECLCSLCQPLGLPLLSA